MHINSMNYILVNLFQKLLFLHQLTHNMTKDCSAIVVFMNNLLLFCGLIDAKIRASDKD